MDPVIVHSMKIFFSSYPEGDGTREEKLKFYLRDFSLFKFRYAGQATLNGEPLDDWTRREIMSSLPGSVTGEVMVYGEPDEALYIDRMVPLFEQLRIDLPGDLAVKANDYLKFLKERKEEGIIIAYYYLCKSQVYPLPELVSRKMKPIHEAISMKHHVSYISIKNDWTPLQKREKRLNYFERIKEAIVLLETGFPDYDTSKAIALARAELNEAELRQ